MRFAPLPFAVFCACLTLLNISVLNHAAAQVVATSKDPLEITADGTLEWHRDKNMFIAQKNAYAKQGTTAIAAQTLTALYANDTEKKFNIQQLTGDTDVVITSQDSAVYGDHIVYDLKSATATMTGQNLKLTTPKETLTADNRFEYQTDKGLLSAHGNAKLIQTNDKGQKTTLQADHLEAELTNDGTKSRNLKKLYAKNNVTIITPTETVTAQEGTYDATTKVAHLTGNVQVQRGLNILQGARAEVDLKTNISRIFGSSSQNNQRVRGVFYPDSE